MSVHQFFLKFSSKNDLAFNYALKAHVPQFNKQGNKVKAEFILCYSEDKFLEEPERILLNRIFA
jgi:hypothetical protein